MKINWKVRLQNPMFIAQIIISIFLPILGYMGLTAQDLTTWTKLFEVVRDALLNPYCIMLILVSVYSTVVDFTTKGINDNYDVMRRKKIK